jgi:hypothetical protein
LICDIRFLLLLSVSSIFAFCDVLDFSFPIKSSAVFCASYNLPLLKNVLAPATVPYVFVNMLISALLASVNVA